MNFQHQIAKSSNNPTLELSKAAYKYDVEALAELTLDLEQKLRKAHWLQQFTVASNPNALRRTAPNPSKPDNLRR